MSTIDAKKFYNEVMPEKQGADYEHARWHKNAVARVGYEQTRTSITTALPAGSIQRILEIGPGAGTWTKLLLTKYPTAEFTLLDISREMLNRSQATLGQTAPIEYVEAAFGDYANPQPFDYIFSSRMLEYMEDKAAFAKNIAALLPRGGRGTFITKYPHYTRRRLLGERVSNFHQGQVLPSVLAKEFRAAGLVITTIKPVTVVVPFFKSALLNKYIGALVRALPLTVLTAPFVESYLIAVEKS